MVSARVVAYCGGGLHLGPGVGIIMPYWVSVTQQLKEGERAMDWVVRVGVRIDAIHARWVRS